MPNNYLSVLYQHIIQVENKNVGLKVEGHKHTIAPPVKKLLLFVLALVDSTSVDDALGRQYADGNNYH